MTKKDLLRALLNSSTRSIIIESGSPAKAKQYIIDILQEKYCHYSFDGPCKKCKDCTRIASLENNVHPDLLYFGGPLFSIDNSRQLVRATQTSPMEFEHRYVVFDVDKYSQESQNAILKLLEEDSDFEANATFLFVVRSASLLLNTIQSRSIQVIVESNSTREFEALCTKKQFMRKEFAAYVCSYKETNLNKACYIKEKFNLSIEDLPDKISKMYGIKDLSLDFFSNLEDLKAYPYIFVYRAIEYEFIYNSKDRLFDLERFYKLFYRKNYNKSKNVRDNLATMLKMWYFINRKSQFDKFYKE